MAPALPRPIRILLAEDNPDDEFLFREALEQQGITCQIVSARDGDEARTLLSPGGPLSGQAPLDLILLDLYLPRCDGREILAAIRTNPALAGVPVAVISSSASETDREDVLRLGAKRFIQKPATLEDLEEIGRIVLELAGI